MHIWDNFIDQIGGFFFIMFVIHKLYIDAASVHVHEFLPSVTQLLLSSFSLSLVGMLQLNDNFPLPSLPSKGCCYGCTNNGSVGMKHPNQANAYNAGHPDGYLPFGHSGGWDASDDDV
jgi:hypothetical protein